MKNRKVFAVIAAMLSMFFLAGIAAAQDQVTVSVTSEPIQQGASCDKAGGFSLSFDSDTVIAAGDVITIDLDFGVVLQTVVGDLSDIVLENSQAGRTASVATRPFRSPRSGSSRSAMVLRTRSTCRNPARSHSLIYA